MSGTISEIEFPKQYLFYNWIINLMAVKNLIKVIVCNFQFLQFIICLQLMIIVIRCWEIIAGS